ncbi:uncharacterized protein LOC121370734 isoform X1 [Gigantopelta aegis]|uniref:uncharacterized protein LOC121370734 isoform X1 n=1 Tax=Gigantopelta aegis TaxID=1735272 RepID=UPI001B88C258|nr:uncharacterized protein LOC121370734 isoform X1 [Gigantopelta aegis]
MPSVRPALLAEEDEGVRWVQGSTQRLHPWRKLRQMKLLLVLLLITCLAFQQLDAWPRWRRFRIRIRIPRPGPIGMLPRSAAGRDVARDLDTDEDERDVLNFVEASDQNGDRLLSVKEFNDKQ